MYRRPKFLEVLLEIRQEMAREADYDVDLFSELARRGNDSRRKSFAITEERESENNRAAQQLKRKKAQS